MSNIQVLAALPNPFTGLTSSLMSEYVEYVADGLLERLGVPPFYQTNNPVSVVVLGVPASEELTRYLVSVHGHAPYSGKVELLRTAGIGLQWGGR